MFKFIFLLFLLFLATGTYATTDCVFPSVCHIGWHHGNPLNLDFGDLLKYNIFTSHDFTNTEENPSDVEGRVAVGGNHQVPLGHTIGEKVCPTLWEDGVTLPPDYNGVTCPTLPEMCCPEGFDTNHLIVQGTSTWPGGRLFFGGACVGNLEESEFGQFATPAGQDICIFGTCLTSDGLTPGCLISDSCVPSASWWNLMVEKLNNISTQLYTLKPNGVTFWEASPTPGSPVGGADYSASPYIWTGHLWFQPLNGNKLHIFDVSASNLKQTTSFFWAPDQSCASLFDQSSIGNCPFQYKPDLDDYIVINVRANPGEECQVSHVNLQALQPYAHNLIWNFGECVNGLKFQGDDGTGMGMYGLILAPKSDLFATGHIDGQVFVLSFTGTAQINWLHLDCLDVPRRVPCYEECINFFGCAAGFNVFVLENYYGESDIEGRLAAGGHISFADGFSVGDKLFPNAPNNFKITDWDLICEQSLGSWDVCDMCDACGQAVIVAGQSITSAQTGRIYFGNWLSPDLSDLDPSLVTSPEYSTINFYGAQLLNQTDCPALNQSFTDSFFDIFTELSVFSQTLCQLPPTGYSVMLNGFLSIVLFGNPHQEVIYIDGTDLLTAHTFDISNWAPGATLIFNVEGTTTGLSSIDLSALEPIADHVLWNFCCATSLEINDVAVWGSILAPDASVNGGNGVINGQLFAKSFNGSTQSNWVPFRGCISRCCGQTTKQCIVNDAYPQQYCRDSVSKSFWLGTKPKTGLSNNFLCNDEGNPETSIQCTFEEFNENSGNRYAKFLGTVCNSNDQTYCLDFDVEFSKYHGPTDIMNGLWDGKNEDGYSSPKFDGFSSYCRSKCYGNMTINDCEDESDIETCPCVQYAKYWDYFETVIGTFIGHHGTPWEGLVGKVNRMGPSVQRGWGGNLFNLEYGLSTWLTFVILQQPNDVSQLTLELNRGYSSDFNFNLDECKYLRPNTECKATNDYNRCYPTCGVGTLSTFGTCINYLDEIAGLSEEGIAQLQEEYNNRCLCNEGYTGPDAQYWTDPVTNTTFVIATTCNTACNQVCIWPDPPVPDDGSSLELSCNIARVCEGDVRNPWPDCDQAYNFIGTVEVCTPDGIIVDNEWTTYFYVDNGIVVEQLWSSYAGDWKQVGNKVIVHGAGWEQGSPPECFLIYFIAHKPNPNPLIMKEHNEEGDKGIHCGFFVDYKEDGEILILEFDTRRRSTNEVSCISMSAIGCYDPDLTNMKPPGADCGGAYTQQTSELCPVCPDNELPYMLTNDGDHIATYVENLEKELGVSKGTFTVVAVDTQHVEIVINNDVTNKNKVIKKLNDKGYVFNTGECSVSVQSTKGNTSDSSHVMISIFIVVMTTILGIMF